MDAQKILTDTALLVGGDRAAQHGDKRLTHEAIARHWNAYLCDRLISPIGPVDVALMMALLKIGRTQGGRHNLDDYRDMAGYAAIAGELADG